MAAPLTKRQTAPHIASIQTSKILKALGEHVVGDREMTATQVSAGLGLLKKTIPDLKVLDHQGGIEVTGTWTVKLS